MKTKARKIKQARIYEPMFEPLGHQYHTPDGIVLKSVTEIIKAELNLYQWGNSSAATRGTNVHLAAQYYDEGDLDEKSISDEVRPYLEQYRRALEAEKIEVLQNEVRRYHPDMLYAGSIDKLAKVNGAASVIDIKTGKPDKWHFIQLGAYRELIRAEFPTEKSYDLHLYPDRYELVEQDATRGYQYFLALLAAHSIKVNLGYGGKNK